MGIFLTLLRATFRFTDEPFVLRTELDFRAEIRFAGERRATDRFLAGLLRAELRRTVFRAVLLRAELRRTVFRAVLLRAELRRMVFRAVVLRRTGLLRAELRRTVFRAVVLRRTGLLRAELRRTVLRADVFRLATVRFTGFRRAVVARRVAVLRRLADEVRALDFLAAEGLRAALFVAGIIITVRNFYPSDGAVAPPLKGAM